MPFFKYTARSESGKIVRGQKEVKDKEELNEYLKGQNLTLTSFEEKGEKAKGFSSFLDRFQKIPSAQKIFFVNNLGVMLRSGFSIGKALAVISQQTNSKKLKNIILDLKQEVESGKTLSSSLKKYKKEFGELFINMIEAGEVSGQLEPVLKKLTTQMKKQHAIIAKVKGALTYPIIVIVAMIGVAVAMMVFVIPQLSTVFAESGANLPMITKILIGVSNFVTHNGLLVSLVLLVLIVFFLKFRKTESGKRFLHKILLRIPIFAPIIKKVNLANFSRSLHSLLKTDIPIVKSFEIISRTVGNYYYQKALKNASEKLKKGISVKSALEEYPQLFTPVILQMISVGEESGTLDSITEEIANFYEEEVDQTMDNLSTIIEPILMLLLGGGVAAMAAAIILPIYSLSEAI